MVVLGGAVAGRSLAGFVFRGFSNFPAAAPVAGDVPEAGNDGGAAGAVQAPAVPATAEAPVDRSRTADTADEARDFFDGKKGQ